MSSEETEMFMKAPASDATNTSVTVAPEHNIKNMSIRALLALIITITGCINYLVSIWKPGVVVDAQFFMLWLSVLSFYFAKPSAPPIPTTSTTTSTASTVAKTNNTIPVSTNPV